MLANWSSPNRPSAVAPASRRRRPARPRVDRGRERARRREAHRRVDAPSARSAPPRWTHRDGAVRADAAPGASASAADQQVAAEVEVALPPARACSPPRRRGRRCGGRRPPRRPSAPGRSGRGERTCQPSSSAAVARICDDGDDAGAADAGDAGRRTSSRPDRRTAARGARPAIAGRAVPRLAPAAGMTVTNDGQSPSRQRVVEVARATGGSAVLRPNSVSTGCTDRQLDLRAAVAAALAHPLVDHDPRRSGWSAVPRLRSPALLGRALLVVDEHGHARRRAAGPPAPPRCSVAVAGPPRRGGSVERPRSRRRSSVVTTIRVPRPRRSSSAATCGDACMPPTGVLAAGHRDGGVVQQLVGDVHAGRDRGADRQRAGVVERAVAEVLDEVRRRRRTAPCPIHCSALAAHLA